MLAHVTTLYTSDLLRGMAETNAKVNGFEAEFGFAVELVKRTGKVIKEAFSKERC